MDRSRRRSIRLSRVGGCEREHALYVDEMRQAGQGPGSPCRTHRDGEPVWVDVDFFDGTKGAHMIISGVSGVATKTSYALFFLRCLTSHPEILGDSARNLRVLDLQRERRGPVVPRQAERQFGGDTPRDGRSSAWIPCPSRASRSGPLRSSETEPTASPTPARVEGSTRSGGRPGVHRGWTAPVRLHRGHRLRQQLTFVAERVLSACSVGHARSPDGPGVVLKDPTT